ncbi:MAG: hypothetical protein VYC55_07905 [Pseudomonadota bacterium]|nr:hypothetical protein [Pseudomonadota bacterium]
MTEQEQLAEAVDRLREGEQVMGLSDGDVFSAIMTNGCAAQILIKLSENSSDTQVYFEEKFNEAAADLLREAYRTKLEHEAGL